MERISVDGRIIPTINGGHGSGNFGHSGRPGKVGGSGKGQDSKSKGETTDKKPTTDEFPELTEQLTSPISSYTDNEEVIRYAKDYIKDGMHTGTGVGEQAYEYYVDEAIDSLGIANPEESDAKTDKLMEEMGRMVESKSIADIAKDLGEDSAIAAIQYGQLMSAAGYARRKAEKGVTTSPAETKKEIRKFIKDTDISEYDDWNAESDISKGEYSQAWASLYHDLRDRALKG